MAETKEKTPVKKPEKPKSPEESIREIGLKNLKAANLMNVASAYLVHKSGQYGEAGDSAMEQYKYFPAFNSGTKAYNAKGEEYDVVKNSIIASREEGARYSGNVSEMKIMKDCAKIVQESLNAVKISDVMGLMGSKANVQDAYLSNLLPKIPQEEFDKLPEDKRKAFDESMELYQKIVGSYQTYLATKNVSEALAEAAKEIPKGLEKLLVVPEKKKDEGKK
jgi:hypothetical protein